MSIRDIVSRTASLRLARRLSSHPPRAALAVIAAAGCTFLAALAVAQSPAPTATAGAATGTSAAGATGTSTGTSAAGATGDKPADKPAGLAVEAYAWPTEASPEPKEEEWAGATALETLDKTVKNKLWWKKESLICTQRALREWVRITCSPDGVTSSFGVVWGMAGDLSGVKAKLPLRKDTDKPPPQNSAEALTPLMASSATVTFQTRPGGATMLQVDEIEFVFENWWSGIVARPSFVVDVSWAAGEKAPSIEIH